MIRYVEHQKLDRKKYDHCVQLDSRGLIYGFTWYLDLVCESWDVLVLNDYDAVWPLPTRKKFGFKYFYRPYAVQQLGIFSKKKLGQAQLSDFIKSMTRSCSFADVYLNEGQKPEQNYKGLQVFSNRNFLLDLHTSYQEIYGRYKSNTQRNIKKSQKNKFSIFENDNPEVLINMFKNERGDDLGLEEVFYKNMQAIMYQSLHRAKARVWTVYDSNNRLCGGAFFIETEKRITLLFTGLNQEGRELGAMFYLMNEFIILASERSKILDFEGSNSDSLARFYAGFGAKEVHYSRLYYNGLPWPLKLMKRYK